MILKNVWLLRVSRFLDIIVITDSKLDDTVYRFQATITILRRFNIKITYFATKSLSHFCYVDKKPVVKSDFMN